MLEMYNTRTICSLTMRTQSCLCCVFLGWREPNCVKFRAHSFSFERTERTLFFFRAHYFPLTSFRAHSFSFVEFRAHSFLCALARAFFSLVSVPRTPRVCYLSSCVRAGLWGMRWRAALVCGGEMVQICGDVQRQEQSGAPPLGSRSISTKLLGVGVRAHMRLRISGTFRW